MNLSANGTQIQQVLENLTDLMDMCFEVWRVNQDIIYVSDYKLTNHVSEYIIDK